MSLAIFLGMPDVAVCIAAMLVEKLVANNVKCIDIRINECFMEITLNGYSFDDVNGVLPHGDRIISGIIMNLCCDSGVVRISCDIWKAWNYSWHDPSLDVISGKEFPYVDPNVVDNIYSYCIRLMNYDEQRLAKLYESFPKKGNFD